MPISEYAPKEPSLETLTRLRQRRIVICPARPNYDYDKIFPLSDAASSELRLHQMGSKMVPDSPAVKRQKTTEGYTLVANSNGYNSEADSGDDIFEGINTTPGARYFTQPTQILDRTVTSSSPSRVKSPEIQILASSPFRPQSNANTAAVSPLQKASRLASLIAPAGTEFKAPYINPQQVKVKERITIDLSDDDGPQCKGGRSSDDELSSRAEIKPSVFASKSAQSSFAPNRSFSMNKAGEGSSGGTRFDEIIANSKFDPKASPTSRLAGNAYDARKTNLGSTTSKAVYPATTRAADSMSAGYGTHRKSQIQSRPERATAVPMDLKLEDLTSQEMRRKVERLRQLKPGAFTVMAAHNALLLCKGNVDDAAEMLLGTPIEISDDDTETRRKVSKLPEEPQMKHQIKVPVASMQERYSSTQNPRKVVHTVATPEKKPRKRLRQGRRIPSSPVPVVETPEAEATEVDDLTDSDDSGLGAEPEVDVDFEGRVLNFINECKVEDLADLANIKVELAAKMIAQRPFKNLNAARNLSDATTTKTGKKSAKQPIGVKIVDTAMEMLGGYEAVDALVTRCEELGKPLTEEIKKWGFDVFGATKSGELTMVSLDDEDESLRDSGIGTPSSKAPSTNGDSGDDDVKIVGHTRQGQQSKFLKKPAIMSPDITLKDYQLVGLNWLALLYKHRLSCILADDMGLGKTCQVIAFLSHLVETGVTGPHLVIVPPSTLENWLREFQQFSPDLVVDPYYGSQKERAELGERILSERDQINVVISTYDFAAKVEDNRFMRHLKPDVCVYDEGHVLKNPKSQRYERLIKIPAKFRLLLTGTPLQNNLLELAALLGFILPEIFRDRQEELDCIFKHKATTRDSDHAALLSGQRTTRAKAMLTPFVLRRKKDQVLKHIPTKTCRVEYCDLHSSQAVVYNGLREKARDRARLRLEGAKLPNDRENNPLMQLRKAAIHPMLFRRHFTDEKIGKMLELLKRHQPVDFPPQNHKNLLKEMSNLSDWYLHVWCTLYPCVSRFDVPDLTWLNSGKVDVLVRLLEDYKTNGDRVLIFSQFTLVLDILESILQTSRTQFARIDGSTTVNDRQTIIDNFRDDESITAFLLSTGAGGTGLNLMFANKVIIFDSSFNPQDDVQAENRAHRVGQTREVEVVRLVTRGTIEEQIYALGQSKLALDSKVAGNESAELKGEELVAKMLLEDDVKES